MAAWQTAAVAWKTERLLEVERSTNERQAREIHELSTTLAAREAELAEYRPLVARLEETLMAKQEEKERMLMNEEEVAQRWQMGFLDLKLADRDRMNNIFHRQQKALKDKMLDAFEKERAELNARADKLEDLLREAEQLGIDPYAAAKYRVVPREQGMVCVKCFSQMLHRGVRPISDPGAARSVKSVEVKRAQERLFLQEWKNVLQDDPMHQRMLQAYEEKNHLTRPSTTRRRSPLGPPREKKRMFGAKFAWR